MNSQTRKPLLVISLLAIAAIGSILLSRSTTAQNTPASGSAVNARWEYTILRLEGPERADASIAALNRYGQEGWEAVELLPPAYDILMKRKRSR